MLSKSYQETLNRLKSNDPSLIEVILTFNEIADIQPLHYAQHSKVDTIKALAEVLKQNTTLLSLHIIPPIRAEGTVVLADGLQQNNTLIKLDLSSNVITNIGAKALAEMLTTNTSITSLDLFDNYIDDVGAQCLLDMLKKNTTLTYIKLNQNQITNMILQALKERLELNQKIAQEHGPVQKARLIRQATGQSKIPSLVNIAAFAALKLLETDRHLCFTKMLFLKLQKAVDQGAAISKYHTVIQDFSRRERSDALFIAVENGHLEKVKTLISQGVSVNKPGEQSLTPLHIACIKSSQSHDVSSADRYTPIIEFLLRHENIDIAVKDKTGRTAYEIAKQHGFPEKILSLFQHAEEYKRMKHILNTDEKREPLAETAIQVSNLFQKILGELQQTLKRKTPESLVFHQNAKHSKPERNSDSQSEIKTSP